jgi:hypothetical protein
MPCKGHLKKTYIEYPFEQGEVINYTLDGVSIHPVTTKLQASFLTQLLERKETHGDFKTSLMAVIGENIPIT